MMQGKEGREREMEGGVGKEEVEGRGNGKLVLAVRVLPKRISLCFSSSLCTDTGNKRQQR